MLVRSINIEDFRNLRTVSTSFNSGINVFYGKNGSGKTNMLEAIFTLLLGRSQRLSSDTAMITSGEDYYRLGGTVEIEGRIEELSVAYQKGYRKKVMANNTSVRLSELFGRHAVVSISPEDIEIMAGAPSARRDFINIYLSQVSQKYLANLSDYQKTLAQKNAYLKQNYCPPANPYDELLVKYGAVIIKDRYEFIESIKPKAIELYKVISGGYQLDVKYMPTVELDGGEFTTQVIMEKFRDKIIRYREREIIMKRALVGPHLDEIQFSINDLPARAFGSQGELRSSVISVKLAVYEHLETIRATSPVLLLDEIFAELDADRKDMLIELFNDFGQIFLTTASDIPESLLVNSGKYYIKDGTVLTG
jgi:DNA replication and repair protein RecF